MGLTVVFMHIYNLGIPILTEVSLQIIVRRGTVSTTTSQTSIYQYINFTYAYNIICGLYFFNSEWNTHAAMVKTAY